MERKERLYSLDILKFICAILIAIWHFNQDIGVNFLYSNIIFEQIQLANITDMFFIISGFLSLYNYSKADFDSYIKHKIKKLYPLAIISVLASLLLMIIYKIIYHCDVLGTKLGLWRIINSLMFTTKLQITKIDIGINNPLWYIGVLMVCYILFWFATKNKNNNTKYLFVILCLIGLGIHEYDINFPFVNAYIGKGIAGFFLGTCLCYLYEQN